MKNLNELTKDQQAEVKRRQKESFGALTEPQAIEVVLAQSAHEEEAAQAAKAPKGKPAGKAEKPAEKQAKDSGEGKTEPAQQ